ncbi:MAG: type VII secretion-associated protein [Corynebacterium sp.]|uniref:type VII secretion-associated protein n=1 Tax=Corynebacterium sp. TaxID=1720 RepID=UPI0026DFA014|nr:type VII secretion-associated protein [Corynebacterium sp.]MDO5670785.1 type VII secretion-associated protein [Corynebacterium sp.]
MSAPTVHDTLTITVLDTATIFEGPDTVYRYDLPGTGIIDGWALAAVLDQARELCSLNWPDVEVVIDADDPTTEVLTRSLLNKGVAAYPAEVLRETPLPEVEDVPVTRPTADAGRHRLHTALRPFPVLIAVVVVAILALSWWVVGGQPTPAESAAPAATATPTTPSPPPTSSTAVSTAASISSTPEPRAVLEHERLRFEAPTGFQLEDREGLLLATGADPELRIRLAADPIYSVPADAVETQIHSMITTDQTLHPLDPERAGRGIEVIRYREEPGDGSTVTWHTWVESEHQISVGCHSRGAPTLPQQAACRMVLDSVTIR